MLGAGMTSANDSSFGDHGPCADVSGESSNEVSCTPQSWWPVRDSLPLLYCTYLHRNCMLHTSK
jgi:hypothetical protein